MRTYPIAAILLAYAGSTLAISPPIPTYGPYNNGHTYYPSSAGYSLPGNVIELANGAHVGLSTDTTGNLGARLVVTKFLSNGLPDSTWQTNGSRFLPALQANNNGTWRIRFHLIQTDFGFIAIQPNSFNAPGIWLQAIDNSGNDYAAFSGSSFAFIPVNGTGCCSSTIDEFRVVTDPSRDRILVAGRYFGTSTVNFITSVYLNGTIDLSFGTQGSIIEATSWPNETFWQDVEIAKDGIYAGGFVTDANLGDSDFTVSKFNFNGQPITSFGNAGSITLPHPGIEGRLHIVPKQKYVLLVGNHQPTGASTNRSSNVPNDGWGLYQYIIAAKISQNGTLDQNFGAGGWLLHQNSDWNVISDTAEKASALQNSNLAALYVTGNAEFAGGFVGEIQITNSAISTTMVPIAVCNSLLDFPSRISFGLAPRIYVSGTANSTCGSPIGPVYTTLHN